MNYPIVTMLKYDGLILQYLRNGDQLMLIKKPYKSINLEA